MPPRDEPLPEGTDQIIEGAAKTSGTSGGVGSSTTGGGLTGSSSAGGSGSTLGGQSSGGSGALVATGGGDDTGGTAGNRGSSNSSGSTKVTDKLVAQVKDQVGTLRGQAGEKLRAYADTGKGRTETLLDDLQEVINDAARAVEQRFGPEYADYGRKASSAVSSLNDKLRGKSVDDLLGDTRDLVRKSPGVAMGVAALVGFALVRIAKTGLEDSGSTGGNDSRPSGGSSTGPSTGTTASGGV